MPASPVRPHGRPKRKVERMETTGGTAPVRRIPAAVALENGWFHETDFYRLPEEVQERVNQRAIERPFRSAEELDGFVRGLLLRS